MLTSEPEENRKLACVGMARATDHLSIITRNGHELLEDLQSASTVGG
ncbi:hypothetical protein BH10CYA1_BH10CYA1_52780 [soil metagenome]